jgi:hypothetical protein
VITTVSVPDGPYVNISSMIVYGYLTAPCATHYTWTDGTSVAKTYCISGGWNKAAACARMFLAFTHTHTLHTIAVITCATPPPAAKWGANTNYAAIANTVPPYSIAPSSNKIAHGETVWAVSDHVTYVNALDGTSKVTITCLDGTWTQGDDFMQRMFQCTF